MVRYIGKPTVNPENPMIKSSVPTVILGQTTESISADIENAACIAFSNPFVFRRAGNSPGYNKRGGKPLKKNRK
jgi:hypothetical protein